MPLPYRAFQVGHPKMNWHEFVKFNVEHFSPTALSFVVQVLTVSIYKRTVRNSWNANILHVES